MVIMLPKPKPKALPQAAPEAPAEEAATLPVLPQGTAKERLRVLVAHEIEHAPHLHSHLVGSVEPLMWAAHRPLWYAAKLGVSLDTFNDVTGAAPGKAPFCKQVMRPKAGPYKGEVLTLLRLGDPQVEKIPEDLARAMSAYFRKATARPTINPDEFGCLVGLAEEWGLDAPAIFKTVVTHWSEFMPIVHNHIDMLMAYAEEKGWKVEGYHLKRQYPSIPTMRLFAPLGPEFHNDQLQAGFKGNDPSTIAYV